MGFLLHFPSPPYSLGTPTSGGGRTVSGMRGREGRGLRVGSDPWTRDWKGPP